MKIYSLRFKIPVLFITAIVLSMFLSIGTVLFLSTKVIDNTIESGFESTSISYKNLINLWLDDNNSSMANFVTTEALVSFLQNQEDPNLRLRAEEALKYFKNSRNSFINFILLDLNGRAIIDSENGILNNVSMNVNDEGWKKFVSGGYNSGGETTITKSVATGNPTYRIWRGIKDNNGRVIGVLAGNVDWGDLIDRYILNAKIGESGRISIIDSNKMLLAHQDKNKILSVENNADYYDEVIRNGNGMLHYKDANKQGYLMSYYNIDNTNWYIIISILESELYASLGKTVLFAVLFSFIIIVIVAVMITGFTRRLISPLKEALRLANLISTGDLTFDIREKYLARKDEIGELIMSFDHMKTSIKNIINIANSNVALTKRTAYSLSYSNKDLASRTLSQAADLEKTAEATEEISSTIKKTAENAAIINDMMINARNAVEEAGSIIAETAQNTSQAFEYSQKISGLVKFIEDIAFQTNILALNASVEAARAGDQGRGFAVVASEVRNLAQTTQSSVNNITSFIGESNEKVKKATDSANMSRTLFEDIESKIEETTKVIADMANTTKEQLIGIDSINNAMSNMDAQTQGNSSLVSSMNESSKELEQQMEELADAMSFFKVGARQLEWLDQYYTHNKTIDSQHVQIIEYANKVHSALYNGVKADVDEAFKGAINYTKYHFAEEQKIQVANKDKYHKIKEHFEEHRRFEKAIDDQYKAFKSSSDWKKVATDFSELLAKLLIEHIGVWDKEFVRIAGIKDS
ncbi:methyl-accepting chemotaxis protein [Brachyspira murdochii]|uniref:Chemotaxis protein n=1 Tax=Brachyspira murdochii TaxID=84378 RepID=A0ABX5B439_9SPIR|nr:methyl-accepting chemotaxis protein [Brachyspira murdochii]PPS22060.1 chemotaxis protein [Brachyspira murdochii]